MPHLRDTVLTRDLTDYREVGEIGPFYCLCSALEQLVEGGWARDIARVQRKPAFRRAQLP